MTNLNSEMSTKEAYFASLAEWARQASIAQNPVRWCPGCLLMANNAQQDRMGIDGYGLRQAATPTSLFGHIPGQLGGQMPGQIFGQVPGQMPGEIFGQLPGQMHGQMPGQIFGQMPGQLGGQMPGELREVMPERGLGQVVGFRGLPHLFGIMRGYEYVVASYSKRAFAEAIDLFILLITKVFLLIILINYYEIQFGKKEMQQALEEEFSLEFKFTSDLIIVDVVSGLVVCLYEASWTFWNNGATPGKYLMKVRIYYVKTILNLEGEENVVFDFQRLDPLLVLIYPAETPSLFKAFIRSLLKQILLRIFIKNMQMMMFFPISLMLMLFQYNRSIYDILASTIVVDTSLQPNHVAIF